MKKIATIYKDLYEIMIDENNDLLSQAGLELILSETVHNCDAECIGLISGQYNEDVERRFPKLEFIIVPYTGLNSLDLPRLKEKGIRVFNSSAHGKFVAERALALTLAVLGKIVFYNDNMREGNWSNRLEENRIDWTSLTGKNVAIYGYGVIGHVIQKLMTPFNVNYGILNYKNRKPDGIEVFDSLESLAHWSDVFIIAAPLDDRTRGSVDQKVITALVDSVLINVGRGAIINEEDLYEALRSNVLKGFGSDVWFQYPKKDQRIIMPSKYPIHTFENVIMTPHCAGFEETSLNLRCRDVAEQLVKIMAQDYSTERKI